MKTILLGEYECSCGEDYTRDVARLGYAKGHREGIRTVAFVDDCGGKDCNKKVCHKCALTCYICAGTFCSDHDSADFAANGLCDDCLGVYGDIPDSPERRMLIEIEGNLQRCNNHYHTYSAKPDLVRVVKIAKEALAKSNAPIHVSTAFHADHKDDGGCIEVIINPTTKRAVLICNECGEDMALGTVRDCPAHDVSASARSFWNGGKA